MSSSPDRKRTADEADLDDDLKERLLAAPKWADGREGPHVQFAVFARHECGEASFGWVNSGHIERYSNTLRHILEHNEFPENREEAFVHRDITFVNEGLEEAAEEALECLQRYHTHKTNRARVEAIMNDCHMKSGFNIWELFDFESLENKTPVPTEGMENIGSIMMTMWE